MRNRILHFWQLRKSNLSLRQCFYFSGLSIWASRLWHALGWVVLISCILYLWSDGANASPALRKTKVDQQAEVIAELSKLLAVCLGDKEGVLWIGNEAFLCHAVSTGVKR